MALRPLSGIAFLALALTASAARGALRPGVKVLFELDPAADNLPALLNATAATNETVSAHISKYEWSTSSNMVPVPASSDSIATLVLFGKFEGDNNDDDEDVTFETITKAANDLRNDSAEIIDSVNSATNVSVTDAEVEIAIFGGSNDGDEDDDQPPERNFGPPDRRVGPPEGEGDDDRGNRGRGPPDFDDIRLPEGSTVRVGVNITFVFKSDVNSSSLAVASYTEDRMDDIVPSAAVIEQNRISYDSTLEIAQKQDVPDELDMVFQATYDGPGNSANGLAEATISILEALGSGGNGSVPLQVVFASGDDAPSIVKENLTEVKLNSIVKQSTSGGNGQPPDSKPPSRNGERSNGNEEEDQRQNSISSITTSSNDDDDEYRVDVTYMLQGIPSTDLKKSSNAAKDSLSLLFKTTLDDTVISVKGGDTNSSEAELKLFSPNDLHSETTLAIASKPAVVEAMLTEEGSGSLSSISNVSVSSGPSRSETSSGSSSPATLRQSVTLSGIVGAAATALVSVSV
jgi:hypothetical protein